MDRPVSVASIALHLLLAFAVLAATFFSTAGTLYWLEAWIYICMQMAISAAMTAWLAKHDPALLKGRMSLLKPAARGWDVVFMLVVILLATPYLMLPGFDAVRYGWSAMPLWLECVGFIGIGCSMWLIFRVMQENSFAVPMVEVQRERGHRVVDSGPYAHVRHPMYSGFIVFVFSLPLALGSCWTLLLALLLTICFIIRIFPEERVLRAELEGYGDYAERVPYRLIPGLW